MHVQPLSPKANGIGHLDIPRESIDLLKKNGLGNVDSRKVVSLTVTCCIADRILNGYITTKIVPENMF